MGASLLTPVVTIVEKGLWAGPHSCCDDCRERTVGASLLTPVVTIVERGLGASLLTPVVTIVERGLCAPHYSLLL